jgi:hypothetical protein
MDIFDSYEYPTSFLRNQSMLHGVIRVERDSSDVDPLTVILEQSAGDADSGDYSVYSSYDGYTSLDTIIIPANETTVTLEIIATWDEDLGPDEEPMFEFAQFSIVSSFDYDIGASSSDTMAIIDSHGMGAVSSGEEKLGSEEQCACGCGAPTGDYSTLTGSVTVSTPELHAAASSAPHNWIPSGLMNIANSLLPPLASFSSQLAQNWSPDWIHAELTFDGNAGSDHYYDPDGLGNGQTFHITEQAPSGDLHRAIPLVCLCHREL